MRKSLTWAAVGAVAAAGALSVAGVASATTAAVKPTSLTIRTSAASIQAGKSDVISGTLSTGHTVLGGEPVRLDTVDAHGHLHVGPLGVTAGKTGLVTFKVTPHDTTTFELVFPGARGLAPSHSGRAVVKVVKIATTLTAAPATQSIVAGSKATITGTLDAGTTPLAGKAVFLWRVDAKGNLVARVGQPHITAKTTGMVTFTVAPLRTTSYKLVFPGTLQLKAARSAAASVTVTKTATALSLSASATSIKKGSTVTLTGKLMAGAAPLKGQVVDLYSVGAGGKLTLLQHAAKLTDATGTVTFIRAPGATITFELVFHGTPLFAGSKSAAVAVTVTK
jgi:hypothetical protein